ncbi:TPA: RusA family crossover junction endodeoxyribonuclease, partial [Candidatus Poribacteria bacterium]|nr:RusA family crossover junction endodeoxyribonuclease [Candidatus Poribacteria bacterium]
DNCLKFILDSLQPAVMVDDKLVVEAKVVKYWCKSEADEKTDVELMVLE